MSIVQTAHALRAACALGCGVLLLVGCEAAEMGGGGGTTMLVTGGTSGAGAMGGMTAGTSGVGAATGGIGGVSGMGMTGGGGGMTATGGSGGMNATGGSGGMNATGGSGGMGTTGGSGGMGMTGGSGGMGMTGGMGGGDDATFTEVYSIISMRCGGGDFGCHAMGTSGGLNMQSQTLAYMNLVGVASEQCNGETRVVAGDAEASLIIKALEGTACVDQMPYGRDPLSADELGTIRSWIAAGALDN
jgi:hypothetical protein